MAAAAQLSHHGAIVRERGDRIVERCVHFPKPLGPDRRDHVEDAVKAEARFDRSRAFV